jgi:DNA processing protein
VRADPCDRGGLLEERLELGAWLRRASGGNRTNRTSGRWLIVPAPCSISSSQPSRKGGDPVDVRVAAAWSLLCRGRTAWAARRLLLERRGLSAVLSLTSAEALEIAREPAEAVLPLLEPDRVAGIDEQIRRMEGSGARLVGLLDADYPALLREIPDPPVFLYARGDGLVSERGVAIVGSRRPSRAGAEAAKSLAGALAREGIDVVSGFARGIDGAAHRAALEESGRTTAVLGTGVDVVYPPEHGPLAADVVRSGALVSEFPMGTSPQPHHFPIRNRLIAGMVPLVVVVEAAERSGSLITARHAADFGRDVAAVPGAIVTPGAAGSNALLKDGAILVRSVEDLLAELPGFVGTGAGRRSSRERDGGEGPAPGTDAGLVLQALDFLDPQDADALAAATGLDAARLSAALVLLELDGLAEPVPGASFVRRKARG